MLCSINKLWMALTKKVMQMILNLMCHIVVSIRVNKFVDPNIGVIFTSIWELRGRDSHTRMSK